MQAIDNSILDLVRRCRLAEINSDKQLTALIQKQLEHINVIYCLYSLKVSARAFEQYDLLEEIEAELFYIIGKPLKKLAHRYAFLCRYSGFPTDVRGLWEEAVWTVWIKLNLFDCDRGAFEGWACKIVKNHWLSRARPFRNETTWISLDEIDETSNFSESLEDIFRESFEFASFIDCIRMAVADSGDEEIIEIWAAFEKGIKLNNHRELSDWTDIPYPNPVRNALSRFYRLIRGNCA